MNQPDAGMNTPVTGMNLPAETEPPKISSTVKEFLIKLMEVEKRYAHELKSATSDRRSDVVELVSVFSAKELESQ